MEIHGRHKEKDESIDATTSRELIEEKGAKEFSAEFIPAVSAQDAKVWATIACVSSALVIWSNIFKLADTDAIISPLFQGIIKTPILK